MNYEHDDDIAKAVTKEDQLAHVTEAKVELALRDFPLALVAGKDTAWLAMAVRRVLGLTIPDPEDGSKRPSNSDVRDELNKLAATATDAWLQIFQHSEPAASALLEHAWRTRPQKTTRSGNLAQLANPPDLRRFKSALTELDWTAHYLRSAAAGLEDQEKRWRSSQERELRIEQAHHLARVYEAAFAKSPTANNFPHDSRHNTKTPFMDFYSRMMGVAFNMPEPPNLAEVAKDALKRHRTAPLQLAPGLVRGL